MLIFQGRLLSIWKVGITIFLLLPVLQSYSVKVRKCFQHYKYQLLTIKYIFFKVVITYENVILIICMVRIKACSIFDFQRQMFFIQIYSTRYVLLFYLCHLYGSFIILSSQNLASFWMWSLQPSRELKLVPLREF